VKRVRTGAARDAAPCIVMEEAMIRIVLCVVVFIATAALTIHFWIGARTGEGASMLWLVATVTAFLAFVALVVRPWLWLRSLLLAGALATGALVVDQAVYLVWHERFESFVTGLRDDVERGSPELAERMSLRPTSLRIEPGQGLLFTFEPPLLAWTYHVDAASPRGHRMVARWHRLLARAASGTPIDPIALTIIEPHQAFSVSVATSEDILACREEHDRQWMVSVEAAPGGHSL
jgi:hypothetical protein